MIPYWLGVITLGGSGTSSSRPLRSSLPWFVCLLLVVLALQLVGQFLLDSCGVQLSAIFLWTPAVISGVPE